MIYDLTPWLPRVRDTATMEAEIGSRAWWGLLRENYYDYRAPTWQELRSIRDLIRAVRKEGR